MSGGLIFCNIESMNISVLVVSGGRGLFPAHVSFPPSPPHLSCSLARSRLVLLTGLEGNLEDSVTQSVAIEAGDGHGRFVVVGHGDKAKALALVGGEVADHFDVGDGPKGTKELPQDALICLWREVVHKDAPASTGGPRQVDSRKAGHAVDRDGREPGDQGERTTLGVRLAFYQHELTAFWTGLGQCCFLPRG